MTKAIKDVPVIMIETTTIGETVKMAIHIGLENAVMESD